jgi:hypothetical protein
MAGAADNNVAVKIALHTSFVRRIMRAPPRVAIEYDA